MLGPYLGKWSVMLGNRQKMLPDFLHPNPKLTQYIIPKVPYYCAFFHKHYMDLAMLLDAVYDLP